MVAFADRKLVVASNRQRAISVLDLFAHKRPPLRGNDRRLVPELTEGLMVWGAAIDLNKIDRDDYSFPILRQHQTIVYRLGERDAEIYEEMGLLANSEEVASKMKTVLEGYVALFDLWAGQKSEVKRLVEDIEISQRGTWVDVKFQGDAQTTMGAMDAMLERLPMSKQQMLQQ